MNRNENEAESFAGNFMAFGEEALFFEVPSIENMMGTVRRVCRNVKRWRSASMALRWTAAAMQEAAKGFRRLKAHKQLPALRAALQAHQMKSSTHGVLARQANAT